MGKFSRLGNDLYQGRKSYDFVGHKALWYAVSRGRPRLLWRFFQSCYVANESRRLNVRHLHAHCANRPATVAHLASRIAGIPFSFTAHAADIFKDRVSPLALVEKMRQARFVITVSPDL